MNERTWFDLLEHPKSLVAEDDGFVCRLGFNRRVGKKVVGVDIEEFGSSETEAIRNARAEFEFLSPKS